MTHIVIITGVSGRESYLGQGREVLEEKRARKFRSPDSAATAGQAHIRAYPPVVQRAMKFKVEPAGASA